MDSSDEEELKQASYKIAEEVYKQQQASGAAGAGPQGAGPDMGGANAGAGADSNANANNGTKSGFDKGSAEDVDYEVHDN